MKIAFYNIYEELNKSNFMFENHNADIGDNLLLPLVRLKEEAQKHGLEVGTVDIISIEQADAIVFMDFPGCKNPVLSKAVKSGKSLYLIALESPLIRPESFEPEKHLIFKKVFTWNDDLVRNNPSKYLKINYSFDLTMTISKDLSEKKKLITLIAGNKSSQNPLELYSKRIEAIRWFEQNHPEDFDLYGTGWDEYTFCGPRPFKALNRFKHLKRALAPSYPSYRGPVERKHEVLTKYKFAICYENAHGIPGYITEKIFDCFIAGCVPVYWGASNVADYIPRNCFIDKNDFFSYDQLYDYLVTMDNTSYVEFLDNISFFWNSNKSETFSCDNFSRTIVHSICNDEFIKQSRQINV